MNIKEIFGSALTCLILTTVGLILIGLLYSWHEEPDIKENIADRIATNHPEIHPELTHQERKKLIRHFYFSKGKPNG